MSENLAALLRDAAKLLERAADELEKKQSGHKHIDQMLRETDDGYRPNLSNAAIS